MATKKKISELTVRAPFKDLFPTDPEVVDAITEGMKEEGYDTERPVFTWRDGHDLVVIDGHTRLEAARRAKIKEVPVVVRRVKDEDAALALAITEQRDRRNMTKVEIVEAIAEAMLRRNGDSAESASSRKVGSRKGTQTGGSTPDPVKQAITKHATRALGKVGKRTIDEGTARARKKVQGEQAKGTAKKKRDIEKASLEQFAPPEMRKCHELVAHALDDLRKAKRYAREANAATLENIKKTEKLSGEIRQIIEKENER